MSDRFSYTNTVRDDRFPHRLFIVDFVVLLLMSGIHIGLIVGMNEAGWNKLLETVVPLVYWSAVAIGLTIYTRHQVRKIYEDPMHMLAEATRKVAAGDFSVYVPPIHTLEGQDYVDVMIVDFNKMVAELGSIETLKTDFTANVSHEIKTPLTIIHSNAELLRLTDLNAQQQEYADTIYQTSLRLADLIGNILRLNRLEKQTITPQSHPYDVCAQLAECALGCEAVWEQKEQDLDADMEDAAFITADPSLMELVWNNLLSNAIKFTPRGGSIRIKESSDQDHVYVSVTDTGCGMDEATQAHIFEKFYQGDTSHATAGNGLGLALALRVLQISGFEIRVDSTPGQGSTFTVVMPRTEADVATGRSQSSDRNEEMTHE